MQGFSSLSLSLSSRQVAIEAEEAFKGRRGVRGGVPGVSPLPHRESLVGGGSLDSAVGDS